jgi:hypothetical protein
MIPAAARPRAINGHAGPDVILSNRTGSGQVGFYCSIDNKCVNRNKPAPTPMTMPR